MTRFAISEMVEDAAGRMSAVALDGIAYFVADVGLIPPSVKAAALEEGRPLLFKYHDQDQFCRYVDMAEVQEVFNQYQAYLDANGYRSWQDAVNLEPRAV